jgi:hypothetical protein
LAGKREFSNLQFYHFAPPANPADGPSIPIISSGMPPPTPRGPDTPRIVVHQNASNDDGTEAQFVGKTSSPSSGSASDTSSGFPRIRSRVGSNGWPSSKHCYTVIQRGSCWFYDT